MKPRWAMLAIVLLSAAFMSNAASLHGQQAPAPQHEHQAGGDASGAPGGDHAAMMGMMAGMHASDQKLDDLVKTMNAANGSAKTAAMAELLTALVADRHAGCEQMMDHMMSMMSMPGMQMEKK